MTDYPILELRQYTLYPGQRDVLISLFEDQFLAGQQSVGIRVDGQFRRVGHDDQFVWLRSFQTMEQRQEALSTFYSGAGWLPYRDRANATMIDSDNVLLLRPVQPEMALPTEVNRRTATGVVLIAVFPLDSTVSNDSLTSALTIREAFASAGAEHLGLYVTDDSPNTFPALPVRSDGPFWVFLERFEKMPDLTSGVSSAKATVLGLTENDGWQADGEYLVLQPTQRSGLE